MRNSKRNGFIKSLTAVLAVVLMLALMLTGCTDKDAQQLANNAQSAADQAQKDANSANEKAEGAQDGVDNNKTALEDLKATVDALPTDEAVANAILDTLNKYVKGEEGKLTDESIVTYDELVKFLTSAEMTALLGKYATVAVLEEKITGVNTSVSNLDNKVTETLKGYYTKAEIDTLKTELNNAIKAAADKAAKNTEDLGKVDGRVKALEEWVEGAKTSLLTKSEFNTFKTNLDATIATLATKDALDKAVNEFNAALNNYATKTDLGDVQTALGNLNTTLDGVKNALDTHKTAYENKVANIESWITEANDKLANIEVNAGSITANANEILALKGRVSDLETAKTKLEGDVKTLTEDLGKLEEKVTKEVEKKLAELEKKFGAEVENLKKQDEAFHEKINSLYNTTEELKKTVELNRKALDEKINYVLDEIQKLANKLDEAHKGDLEDFKAATTYIQENDPYFDTILAQYAENKLLYEESVYNAIVASINANRIAFRRALTLKDAQDIFAKFEGEADTEAVLLADALAAAIDYVWTEFNGYILITSYLDATAANSYDSVEKVNDLLDAAKAQLGDGYAAAITAYKGARNLETEVDAINDKVEAYEALEDFAVANIHNLVAAIKGAADVDYYGSAFADIKLDMLTERADLATQKTNAQVAIDNFATQFEANDPNFLRLVGPQDRIVAANTRLAAIDDLIEEGEALSAGIDTFLAGKVIEGTDFYYYYDLEALEGHLADPITVWAKANIKANDDATVIDDFIASYNDLLYAIDYAEDMTVNFYDTAAPVIELMKALLDCKNVYTPENAELCKKANLAYLAWGYQNTNTKYGFVDEFNHDAILGKEFSENYAAAADLMRRLEAAAKSVDAINEKIKALVEEMNDGKFTIYTMGKSIRPLREEIVKWLNSADIAVPEETAENAVLINWITKTLATENEFDKVQYKVTAEYVESNWNMLKSAEFISVIKAYDALVKKAIDAANAEGGVVKLIDAINTADAYILYQNDAIKAARAAFDLWVGEYNISVADLAKFDLGETYKAETDLIVEHYQTLNAAETSRDNALVAAQNAYKALKDDLATAISTEYAVTIFASKIPASYEKVMDWVEEYIDEERGFNETIKALENILTEEEVEAIETKSEAYEALVEQAVEDAEAFKTIVDALKPDAITVYSYGDYMTAQNAWTAWQAAYGVKDPATELVSDDLDERLENVIDLYNAYSAFGTEYMTFTWTTLPNEMKNVEALLAIVLDPNYTYTIYSYQIVEEIRAAYNAWADLAGMTSYGLAAYDNADIYKHFFFETMYAQMVEGYKEVLTAIITAEATANELADAKDAETQALKDAIANLDKIGGADKVTANDIEAIDNAYNAFIEWKKDIVGNFWSVDGRRYTITPDEHQKLVAYNNAAISLKNLIAKVEDAVEDLKDGVTEDNFNDAKDALDELREANGGTLNGAVAAETVAAIAAAEMQVNLNKALDALKAIDGLTDVDAPEGKLDANGNAYANYAAYLEDLFKSGCKNSVDNINNADLKAQFESGNETVYQSLADHLNNQWSEYLTAAEEAVKKAA